MLDGVSRQLVHEQREHLRCLGTQHPFGTGGLTRSENASNSSRVTSASEAPLNPPLTRIVWLQAKACIRCTSDSRSSARDPLYSQGPRYDRLDHGQQIPPAMRRLVQKEALMLLARLRSRISSTAAHLTPPRLRCVHAGAPTSNASSFAPAC